MNGYWGRGWTGGVALTGPPTASLECGFITPQAAVGNGEAGPIHKSSPGPSEPVMGWAPPALQFILAFAANTHPSPPSFPVFQAQAVTLTVAQAFKVAFEFWQASKEGESFLRGIHCE